MSQQTLTESLRETLSVFDGRGEPLTTPEVADRLDLGRRSTYARLERLVEEDRIETKKVGASARVWWRPPTATDEGTNGKGTNGEAEDERTEGVTGLEQQFRSLVKAVEEYAIFMLDPEGYVRTWNPGAERIKGYDADEIIGEHFSTFYPEEDREAGVPEANLAAASEGGSVEDEGWRVRADGSRFWANVTITALRDGDGDLTGYAKVTRDMTDRRERERELREQKAFVESLLDAQPDLVYSFDTDGEFLRLNDRFREVTGYTDAEIERMHPVDFVVDRAAEKAEGAIEWVLEHGEQVTVELPLVTADGQEIPYEFTASPIRDETGDIVGFTGVGRDISERKTRERQLERQRDELEAELDDVFTRIDEAFFAVDEDWRLTYVNDRAAELVRLPVGELVGARVWDEFTEIAEGRPREMAERAVETQESVEFELYSEALEAWLEVRAYPSETGLSVYVRDITERKEREQELRLTRDLLERTERIADVGGWEIDTETMEVFWTDHLFEILGRDEEEEPPLDEALDVYHEEDRPVVERAVDAALDSGEPFDVEVRFQRPDGEVRWLHLQGTPETEDGEVVTLRGSVQDVTERKERERELEQSRRRYRTLVEHFPNGAVALVDEELRYRIAGGSPADVEADTGDDLEGAPLREALSPELADVLEPRYRAALAGESSTFEREHDGRHFQFQVFPVRDDEGEVFAAMGMSQDITGRKERERELARYETILETVNEGVYVVDADRNLTWVNEAYAELLGYSREELVGENAATVVADEDEIREAEVVAEEHGPENTPRVELELVTSTGERVSVAAESGVLPEDEGSDWFRVGVVRDITDRKERERELREQRERLAALNNLYDTVQDITEAVIEQSTREEIETIVCERLAESDSYEFAWIGEVDPVTESIDPRVEAGVEGYGEEISVSTDSDDRAGRGPGGRAARTREIQVSQNVLTDPDFEPWREHAEAYGYRSVAAIPIVHEDTLYGLLGVYADRPTAFERQERAVVGQLGEVVGHAISAIEQKRALTSDEVTEIDFAAPDVFEDLDLDSEMAGTITLERAVPIGDGEFLEYGTVDEEGMAALEALVENHPAITDVEILERGPDTARFEIRASDPPVVSAVASEGGYMQRVEIEDGDLYATIHLPPTVAARRIIDAVEEALPKVELLTQRQVARDASGPTRVQRTVTEELTERQRAALETALYSGFFDWPRKSSGEDVAASLGIAPPTFSQHLRKAQHKVFRSLFPSSTPA